jgi:hypothetical protein
MPIVPTAYPVASPREEIVGRVGEMINHAVTSSDAVSPWALAEQLLEAIEEEVERVADDGTVIYRM